MPVPLNIQAEDTVTIVNEAELACLICSLDELGSLSKLNKGLQDSQDACSDGSPIRAGL